MAGASVSLVNRGALGRLLREHKLRSPFSRPGDFVFCSAKGSPLSARNVAQRGLGAAASRAGIDADGKLRLRFHDLRHAYASLLIDQGESIVWISRQLGHASPSITLNVCSHVFARQENAERMQARMEQRYGSMLDGEHSGEQNDPAPPVPVSLASGPEPARLSETGTHGH